MDISEIRWAVEKDKDGKEISRKLQVLAGNWQWIDVPEIIIEGPTLMSDGG